MSDYYYMTKQGEFIESTKKLDDPKYLPLTELEYLITRAIVRGYDREQIISSTNIIFLLMDLETPH